MYIILNKDLFNKFDMGIELNSSDFTAVAADVQLLDDSTGELYCKDAFEYLELLAPESYSVSQSLPSNLMVVKVDFPTILVPNSKVCYSFNPSSSDRELLKFNAYDIESISVAEFPVLSYRYYRDDWCNRG